MFSTFLVESNVSLTGIKLKRYYGGSLFKGALSGLKQFMAVESCLKMMKNVFYFILKALFVLKRFKFLSYIFGHIEKAA